MKIQLKQFLNSETCLSCKLCCEYATQKDEWRAKVTPEDVAKLSAHTDQSFHDHEFLKNKKCHGLFLCTFLNPDDRTCGIYENRPFECRLYPFVLTNYEGRHAVSVHLACPYVQDNLDSDAYKDYIKYLKEVFAKPEIKDYLTDNPFLFSQYSQPEELKEVFSLSL